MDSTHSHCLIETRRPFSMVWELKMLREVPSQTNSIGSSYCSPAAGEAVWRPTGLGRQHGARHSRVSDHGAGEVAW